MGTNLALRLAFLPILWLSIAAAAATTTSTPEALREFETVPCETYLVPPQPLTLKALRERAEQTTAQLLLKTPAPGFDNIEVQSKFEQQPDQTAPLALQQINGPNIGFVSIPAPTSPDAATINLADESYSFPVLTTIDWEGQKESTAAYVTLPKDKVPSAGGPVIGTDNKIVLVHLHGGGTPTATGKNAMSIGEKIAGLGFATVAIDLPGHGLATRRVKGLETMEGQVDWILKMIDQLVAPGVKIVLSGHSWGGEFATYMWLHSDEPKYARISEFIALSPPVDVSMGGDLHKKLEFGDYWEDNYVNFESRIAPADFEFQKNMLNNGKDSDIGAYMTAFSDFDFLTKPLTMERLKKLKRATTIIAEFDGVCYVGREHCFDAIYPEEMRVKYDDSTDYAGLFADPKRPSRFILLGAGQTWKGEQNTGHNIFDLYIPGTKKPLIYTAIGDLLTSIAGESDVTPANAPQPSILNSTYRNWANFPAFREMVKSDVEYIETNSPQMPELHARRMALEDYIAKVDAQVSADNKLADAAAQKAIEQLRVNSGLKDNLNLKRAQDELAIPELTADRKAELEAYMKETQVVEEGLRTSYVDKQADIELAALNKEFGKLIEELGIPGLESYKPILDALMARKDLSKKEQQQRSDLSRLHQRYAEMMKRKQGRFGAERDARIAQLKAPAGVTDPRAAQRELTADRSPERRAALQAFVDGYAKAEADARASVGGQAHIDAIPRPAGVNSPKEAQDAKILQAQIMGMTYAPPGEPEIADLAKRIEAANQERESLISGGDQPSLQKLQKSVDDLRTQRSNAQRKWEALWKEPKLTSPYLTHVTKAYQMALDNFKDLYRKYETAKGEWLLKLKLADQLTEENILNMPAYIMTMRTDTQNAKLAFIKKRELVEKTKLTEALGNDLTGEGADVAHDLARQLFDRGQYTSVVIWSEQDGIRGLDTSPSITRQLRMEEDYLEARRRQLSLAEREIAELRFRYARAMQAKGYQVPYTVEAFPIYEMLNRPLSEVQALLERNPSAVKALTTVKSRWDEMLAQLRRLSQSKDAGGY